MIGVAGDLDQFVVFHVIQERAGIRAILGASAPDNATFHSCV